MKIYISPEAEMSYISKKDIIMQSYDFTINALDGLVEIPDTWNQGMDINQGGNT